jgi:hypothetical protein
MNYSLVLNSQIWANFCPRNSPVYNLFFQSLKVLSINMDLAERGVIRQVVTKEGGAENFSKVCPIAAHPGIAL